MFQNKSKLFMSGNILTELLQVAWSWNCSYEKMCICGF